MLCVEVLYPETADKQENPSQTSQKLPPAHKQQPKQGAADGADSPGDGNADAAAPEVTAVNISSGSALAWTLDMLGALQAALAARLKQYHHASLAEAEAALADLPAVAR